MRTTILLISLLLTTLAEGATPIDGWYGSLFGGYVYLPNNLNNTTNGITRTNTNYRPGYDAGGSFGFKNNPMRYEGEIAYLNANIRGFNANGIKQTEPMGYTNAVLAMANVYYDFPGVVCTLQPYLGLGIGYGWFHTVLDSAAPVDIPRFSSSNSAFSYQGIAGLTYNYSENYAITVAYNYLGTQNITGFGHLFQAHIANVGAVYRFDGNKYK